VDSTVSYEKKTRSSALAERERESASIIALLYGAKGMSMLNRLGLDHEFDTQTDWRMDGQTEAIVYSADKPISIKLTV